MNALPFSFIAAERITQMAEAASIPGLCVVTTAPGKDAVHFHGEEVAGSGSPVGEGSWFQLASTAKHVTACVVLRLAARGALSIDEAIGTYLPDMPAVMRDRSVRSLLHHTSGLPEYLAYVADEQPPATRAEFMALAATLPHLKAEGHFWSYSNTNYILLGLLVAEITGEPCGIAVDSLFRDRLGQAGARAASPAWARRANAQRLGPDAHDEDSRRRDIFGDGDAAFTANGALGWLKQLIDGMTIEGSGGNELFAPAKIATGSIPYGCGWFLESVGGSDVVHHAGHYDGWSAMAYINRSLRCGVIAMSNIAPGNTRAIRAIALRALEDFVAGSTPLAQLQIHDERPALTASILRQLYRADYDADPGCFAPALQLSLELQGSVRGMINLWAGVAPTAFQLVDELVSGDALMRRYRACYADRTEHLHVRTNAADQIFWAWPL